MNTEQKMIIIKEIRHQNTVIDNRLNKIKGQEGEIEKAKKTIEGEKDEIKKGETKVSLLTEGITGEDFTNNPVA